uniref:Uncharacterized LOC100185655 n=1 Tax=Ciona intestinalis TaxID=7719 RepID=A0A1W3JHR7_CIOIN|nr:uncharacterized protein LOC100185655 [Ciona intestinalis]XP_018672570.1 uncharacterized protein LOC100185655 [Ciona intestinalis]XP_026695803.1 uncharacterized protein LOC100185655 [Ciona intestinalis]|eukprot:XP_018672569.1 uncharacterized protein LOC100185655 [Ciona intestinalis]
MRPVGFSSNCLFKRLWVQYCYTYVSLFNGVIQTKYSHQTACGYGCSALLTCAEGWLANTNITMCNEYRSWNGSLTCIREGGIDLSVESGGKVVRAIGLHWLDISATFPITGVPTCYWIYNGSFTGRSFYTSVFKCSPLSDSTSEVTCETYGTNIKTTLSFRTPLWMDQNVTLRCTGKRDAQLTVDLQECKNVTENGISVTFNSSSYLSNGSFYCPGNSWLFNSNWEYISGHKAETKCLVNAQWKSYNGLFCEPETIPTLQKIRTVSEGESLNINCNYISSLANTTYFHVGNTIYKLAKGSQLTLTNLKASDNLTPISCSTITPYTLYFNKSGRSPNYLLKVQYAPQYINATTEYRCSWQIGQTGVCRFEFASNPLADLVVISNNGNTQTELPSVLIVGGEKGKHQGSLKSANVTENDAGTYKVKITSSKFSKGITLTVIITILKDKPPVHESSTNIGEVVGLSVAGGFIVLAAAAIGIRFYILHRKLKGSGTNKRKKVETVDTVRLEDAYLEISPTAKSNVESTHMGNSKLNNDQTEYENFKDNVEVTTKEDGYTEFSLMQPEHSATKAPTNTEYEQPLKTKQPTYEQFN